MSNKRKKPASRVNGHRPEHANVDAAKRASVPVTSAPEPLTKFIARVLWLARWLTIGGTWRNIVLQRKRSVDGDSAYARSRIVSDVVHFAGLTLAVLVFRGTSTGTANWFLLYRPFAIVVDQACVLFNVDSVVYHRDTLHIDYRRWLAIGILNWCEVVVWFATIYLVAQDAFHQERVATFTPHVRAGYLSLVTMTTVGYGDLHPISDRGALLVCLQLGIGVFLTLIVVGRFVGMISGERPALSLSSSRSDVA